MNFTTPRYAILFSNSQNHIVHVINHEWNRSMNVASAVSFVWDTKPDFPSDQTKNIFVLFVCFWKWFVLPLFFKVFQIVFVWKKCFLGVFVTHFICKLSWELNGPILKFFSFTQKVSRLFRDCLASKAYMWKISRVLLQVSFPRKFPNQLFKGLFMRHLF